LIDKALFAIGYIGGIASINTKRLGNVVAGDRFNKQKQQIKLGSEAASIRFVATKIEKKLNSIAEESGDWETSDLKEAVNKLGEQLAYQGFSEDVFAKARLRIIKKYSNSVEVLHNMGAEDLAQGNIATNVG
jgi:hypothetical protein